MRIGIDLDNTIISYDVAFQIAAKKSGLVSEDCDLNKKEIRDSIRKSKDGEFKWQKLQGFVYGEGIKNAILFPGVYRFLWLCRARKIDVEIVSHKTNYGHFDSKKISIRESATNFLRDKGLIDIEKPLIRKVVYQDSKDEKLSFIKQNQYDWFIDDLEEIIFSEDFEDQQSILFSSENKSTNYPKKYIAKSWEEVSQRVLGDWTLEEIKNMVNSFDMSGKYEKIEKHPGRGNSAIYKLQLSNGKKAALKVYPSISFHDRLSSEFNSTKILKELKISNVQKPKSFDKNLGVATFEWIEGKTKFNYGKTELKKALSFLDNLHQNSSAKQFESFPYAADACLKGRDIESQINRRLFQFENLSIEYLGLNNFLNNEFKPLLGEIISWSKSTWPIDSNYDKDLEKNELILSPSDFGFHNAIYLQNRSLVFHDFEYFGWDDPVKLISDFSHHAAMNLSEEMQKFWFKGAIDIYGDKLIERLISAWPLFGLNWCLIILNEYKDEVWNRRCAADETKKKLREQNLLNQLEKSRIKLNLIALNYKNLNYF